MGVSKSEGLTIIAPYLNMSDAFYVLDATDIEDGWMAQALIGQTIVSANNGLFTVDAFPSNGDAREVIQRGLDVAITAGLFTFDRGTLTPGRAPEDDVTEVLQGLEAAKAQARMMEDLMSRLAGNGSGPSLSPGSVDALHGAVQVQASTDGDHMTGMYL